MKLIQLSKGLFAKVDDEDFEFLNLFCWCAHEDNFSGRHTAVTTINHKAIKMHRLLKREFNPLVEIDHIDTDSLNNQKSNLRAATRSENAANRMKHTKTSTPYLGVTLTKKGCFQATIRKDRKSHWLGYFETAEEAALAYNKAAIRLHKHFANLNTL